MIPIRFGIRFAGLITLASGISIATRVFHIWYLPIIPLGTYQMTGEDTGIPTRFSFKSLGAAFFKSWGFIAAVGVTALALDAGRRDPFWAYVAIAAVLFGLVYASWLFLGRTPETRPQTSGYVIVAVIALISFGALGYGVVDRMDRAVRDSFIGQPPKADSPVSAIAMGMGRVKATPASELKKLSEGQMVEFAVEDGYAHGVVDSDTSAYDEWVKVRAGRDMATLSVHREALTVLESQ